MKAQLASRNWVLLGWWRPPMLRGCCNLRNWTKCTAQKIAIVVSSCPEDQTATPPSTVRSSRTVISLEPHSFCSAQATRRSWKQTWMAMNCSALSWVGNRSRRNIERRGRHGAEPLNHNITNQRHGYCLHCRPCIRLSIGETAHLQIWVLNPNWSRAMH